MTIRSANDPLSRSVRCFGVLAAALLVGCGPKQAADTPSAIDIGYGEVDAEHVTGSVGSVDVDEQQEGMPISFAQMLQGEPGVMITERNGRMSIRIRGGGGSFMAGQEPLCVLDDVLLPSAEALWSLIPSSVRSITVLKDAGSTAVYGSRGANGVIVVRTKRGGA